MPPKDRPGLAGDIDEIKNLLLAQGEKLEGLHSEIVTVKTVLLGIPGSEEKGLCGEVKEVADSHYDLRKVVYTLIAFLSGAGILTGTGYGIAELLKLK
jgi:hypothetical protein